MWFVFSFISLENILKKYNLEIFKVENLDIHGGSNRYFIKKKKSKRKVESSVKTQKSKELKYGLHKKITFIKFSERVKNLKKNFFQFLINANHKIKR